MDSCVEHFHEKLLLLKDMMNTDEARKIAEDRHRFMEQFLRELEKETNIMMSGSNALRDIL